MPRIGVIEAREVPADLGGVLEAGRVIKGFAPNDALTMARRPALLRAMLELVRAVCEPGRAGRAGAGTVKAALPGRPGRISPLRRPGRRPVMERA